jgi:hypothetical protein
MDSGVSASESFRLRGQRGVRCLPSVSFWATLLVLCNSRACKIGHCCCFVSQLLLSTHRLAKPPSVPGESHHTFFPVGTLATHSPRDCAKTSLRSSAPPRVRRRRPRAFANLVSLSEVQSLTPANPYPSQSTSSSIALARTNERQSDGRPPARRCYRRRPRYHVLANVGPAGVCISYGDCTIRPPPAPHVDPAADQPADVAEPHHAGQAGRRGGLPAPRPVLHPRSTIERARKWQPSASGVAQLAIMFAVWVYALWVMTAPLLVRVAIPCALGARRPRPLHEPAHVARDAGAHLGHPLLLGSLHPHQRATGHPRQPAAGARVGHVRRQHLRLADQVHAPAA